MIQNCNVNIRFSLKSQTTHCHYAPLLQPITSRLLESFNQSGVGEVFETFCFISGILLIVNCDLFPLSGLKMLSTISALDQIQSQYWNSFTVKQNVCVCVWGGGHKGAKLDTLYIVWYYLVLYLTACLNIPEHYYFKFIIHVTIKIPITCIYMKTVIQVFAPLYGK